MVPSSNVTVLQGVAFTVVLTIGLSGVGLTVTFTEAVVIHPEEASEAVTEYVVVAGGRAVTDCPVVVFKPVDGSHV